MGHAKPVVISVVSVTVPVLVTVIVANAQMGTLCLLALLTAVLALAAVRPVLVVTLTPVLRVQTDSCCLVRSVCHVTLLVPNVLVL